MKPEIYARELEKAIRAKCYDCCGHSRTLARECRAQSSCPLWPYRNNGAGRTAKAEAAEERGLAGQLSLFEEMSV